MKKLDVSQSAMVGISADRRMVIKNPTPVVCDGCGVTVYVSRESVPAGRISAKARGHRLYIVCRKCSEPFMDEVARGGELEGTPEAMNLDGVLDDIRERRKRFLESN